MQLPTRRGRKWHSWGVRKKEHFWGRARGKVRMEKNRGKREDCQKTRVWVTRALTRKPLQKGVETVDRTH